MTPTGTSYPSCIGISKAIQQEHLFSLFSFQQPLLLLISIKSLLKLITIENSKQTKKSIKLWCHLKITSIQSKRNLEACLMEFLHRRNSITGNCLANVNFCYNFARREFILPLPAIYESSNQF